MTNENNNNNISPVSLNGLMLRFIAQQMNNLQNWDNMRKYNKQQQNLTPEEMQLRNQYPQGLGITQDFLGTRDES